MYPHYLHDKPRPAFPATVLAGSPARNTPFEIIILKKELLADIEAAIHQLEKNRQPDQPALLATNGSDDYLLCRYIDTALSQAVARCQAYLLLPSAFAHRISTNHNYGWEEKSIYIGMPRNWPPHCIDALRSVVHSFIVERTLNLFLARLDEKASAASNMLANTYYNDINSMLSSRLGGTKIHPTEFG